VRGGWWRGASGGHANRPPGPPGWQARGRSFGHRIPTRRLRWRASTSSTERGRYQVNKCPVQCIANVCRRPGAPARPLPKAAALASADRESPGPLARLATQSGLTTQPRPCRRTGSSGTHGSGAVHEGPTGQTNERAARLGGGGEQEGSAAAAAAGGICLTAPCFRSRSTRAWFSAATARSSAVCVTCRSRVQRDGQGGQEGTAGLCQPAHQRRRWRRRNAKESDRGRRGGAGERENESESERESEMHGRRA
jgi:hypothetical protein